MITLQTFQSDKVTLMFSCDLIGKVDYIKFDPFVLLEKLL